MIKKEKRKINPTQLPLSAESQELVLAHIKRVNSFFNSTFNVRARMEEVDRQYQREDDMTAVNRAAVMANKYGDKTKLRNITIPIVQPQVDSMQAYLAGVFLQGHPLFGVVGDAENEDAALMYESIIDDDATHGAWVREFMLFFKDNLKYNVSATEVDWRRETTYQLDTETVVGAGEPMKQASVTWEGNSIKRIDLYNAVWDTRCAPAKMHEDGEFFGYTVPKSSTLLKQFIQDLDDRIASNVNPILAGAVDFATAGNALGGKYYIPQINSDSLVPRQGSEFDWFQFVGIQDEVAGRIPTVNAVSTYYMRIIPDNFKMKVPFRNAPQIWKFIIVNGSSVIYAERMTNMHNYLPIVMAQTLEDGLNYQTKSYAQNGVDFQDAATTIWSASLAAQRRAVYDRIFYDPSRISKDDINSTNPIARIPVKSNVYGKPVTEAFAHSSYTNDQFSTVGAQIQLLNSMANTAQGSNPAQQGQFVKGNKTRHEYSDVMGHSNDRQQMLALLLESQYFSVVKHILKYNILQFASSGELFNRGKKQRVKIDPVALRQAAVEFDISDGLLPTDRIISADTFQVMLQAVAASPQMQAKFDIVGMMVYYFKTQGARNIEQFRFTPEQQQQQIAQQQAVTNATQPQQPGQVTQQPIQQQ